MAHDPVNIGTTANDGTGDTLRDAFEKLNANDAELYSLVESAGLTAADVLALLLTVDGAGSGLDADFLDGLSSAAFATALHGHAIADVSGLQAALDSKLAASSYTAADVLSKLLTVDGAGSGLDADLLDGLSSGAFAAAVHAHNITDVTDLQDALDEKGDLSSNATESVDSEVILYSGTTGKLAKRATGTGLATLTAGVLSLTDPATFATAAHTHAQSDVTGLAAALAAKLDAASYTAADVLSKLLTVDGPGSGLDADLLDGMSSAAFAAASHSHAIADVTGLQAALDAKLPSASYTAADVLAKLLTVDGTGSGIDADLLDGQSSAAFAAASHAHAISDTTGLQAALDAKLASSAYTAADVLSKLLTVDGATSGLDADLLDGISSAGFLQVSTYEALTPSWSGLHTFTASILLTSANPRIRILETGLAADTGAWDLNWDAGTIAIRTRTDADGAGQHALSITRPSGTQPLRLFVGGADADLSGFSSTAGNINNFGVVFTAFDVTRNANFALASTQRPLFNFLKYAGTFASPTQITNNTALHQISFSCYNTDTSAIATSAAISTTSTQDWGSAAQGTRMDFGVTPNGTTSRVIGLRLAESQMLSLDGTAALPSRAFQSDIDTGDYRIAANQYGISCGGTLVLDLSTAVAAITATTVRLNTTSATTVGAAGGASALPATPLGYITANVNGTACKIPYYNT